MCFCLFHAACDVSNSHLLLHIATTAGICRQASFLQHTCTPVLLLMQGFGERFGEGNIRDICAEATNAGINFYDTAEVYGYQNNDKQASSEYIVGRCFHVFSNDQIPVAWVQSDRRHACIAVAIDRACMHWQSNEPHQLQPVLAASSHSVMAVHVSSSPG